MSYEDEMAELHRDIELLEKEVVEAEDRESQLRVEIKFLREVLDGLRKDG